ncbi:hypothetical protein C8J56DRAFT_938627, partial [Mycena floridula]
SELKIQRDVTLFSVQFRAHNWAYLSVDNNGQYSLVSRRRQLYRIACPLWAPLINETEIQITNYFRIYERTALWNGRDVDIQVGWENDFLRELEQETIGRGAIRDLDLSYEVLGHLTRDGDVVGMVLEPAEGRMVEYRDRLKVYAAFAKLQAHNVIHAGCIGPSNIMIHKGKVRLLRLHPLRVYSDADKAEVERQAKYWHWHGLEVVFKNLLSKGANDLAPSRLATTSMAYRTVVPAPGTPHHLMTDFVVAVMVRQPWVLASWVSENKNMLTRERKKREKKGDPFPLLDYVLTIAAASMTLEERKMLMPAVKKEVKKEVKLEVKKEEEKPLSLHYRYQRPMKRFSSQLSDQTSSRASSRSLVLLSPEP